MQGELVDLHDDAVEFVFDRVPVLAVLLDEPHDLVDRRVHGRVRARRKSPSRKQVVDLALRRDGRIRPRADAVHVETQPLEASLSRLAFEAGLLLELLPEAAAGRIARVRECRETTVGRLSLSFLVERLLGGGGTTLPAFARLVERALAARRLACVERVELLDGDEHFAAHFHDVGMAVARELLGDARDEACVVGDELADAPVAARGRGGEDTALVSQADRETVDLELREPAHIAPRGSDGLLTPRDELVRGEDVIEAQHALGVCDRLETSVLGGSDRLRRRVLCPEHGVRGLDLLEPVHPRVVRRVVDARPIGSVIRLARVIDAGDEIGCLGACVVEREITGRGSHASILRRTPDRVRGVRRLRTAPACVDDKAEESRRTNVRQSTRTRSAACAGAVRSMVHWPRTRVPR